MKQAILFSVALLLTAGLCLVKGAQAQDPYQDAHQKRIEASWARVDEKRQQEREFNKVFHDMQEACLYFPGIKNDPAYHVDFPEAHPELLARARKETEYCTKLKQQQQLQAQARAQALHTQQVQAANRTQQLDKLWNRMRNECAKVNLTFARNDPLSQLPLFEAHPELEPRATAELQDCEKKVKEQEQKQADARAKQLKAVADARAQAVADLQSDSKRRDPSDLVEKILNYAFTSNEDGMLNASMTTRNFQGIQVSQFAIKESKCAYRLVRYIDRGDGPEKTLSMVLDFTKYDPALFKFIAEDDDGHSDVVYDGQVMLSSDHTWDADRARRGWARIYKEFCTGKRASF